MQEVVALPSGGRVWCDKHWFVFPGSSALTAVSSAVSGPLRGSLTVQCRYGHGWETYYKWWCQGAEWSDCHILVQTDGSEREVKRDRVSIKDNWKSRTFTVTMEDLRWNSADTYWCGIARAGTDLGVTVKVTIDPGKSVWCVCVCVSPCVSIQFLQACC
uniref:Immunoglobulin V-set domain-containing protein n=1 Tax=Neovison vison TaxID=452646 RepID=A0A8C7ATK2_NEOVI